MPLTVLFLPHLSPSVPEISRRIANGRRYAVKVHPITSVDVVNVVLNSGNIGRTKVAPKGPMNPPMYKGRLRFSLGIHSSMEFSFQKTYRCL